MKLSRNIVLGFSLTDNFGVDWSMVGKQMAMDAVDGVMVSISGNGENIEQEDKVYYEGSNCTIVGNSVAQRLIARFIQASL